MIYFKILYRKNLLMFSLFVIGIKFKNRISSIKIKIEYKIHFRYIFEVFIRTSNKYRFSLGYQSRNTKYVLVNSYLIVEIFLMFHLNLFLIHKARSMENQNLFFIWKIFLLSRNIFSEWFEYNVSMKELHLHYIYYVKYFSTILYIFDRYKKFEK